MWIKELRTKESASFMLLSNKSHILPKLLFRKKKICFMTHQTKKYLTACKGPDISFKMLTFALAALWNVIVEQEFALVTRKHEKKNQKT